MSTSVNRLPVSAALLLLSLSAAALLCPTEVLQAQSGGLVAAYGFNETSGTTATDSSGAGNSGVINGPTRTASGRFGAALTFDGVNDIVSIADAASLDLTTGMTIEAWVNPATGSGWRTVVIKEAPGTLSYGLYGNDSGARASGWAVTGGQFYSATSSSSLALDTWTHLAVTYDAGSLRLYRNGVQEGTVGLSGSIAPSAEPLRIGGNLIAGHYFGGRIDEVRIYNRPLSLAEIQADMNTAIGAPVTDSTPPSVSMTAPAAGATVGGSVTVSATATDNVAVAGVQFLLDNAALDAEDTAAPYTVTWNTATAIAGPHTLSARARDAAGNATTSAARTVQVANDTTAPVITGVAASSITGAGATVSWTTSEAANGQVEYGQTTGYGTLSPVATGLTTGHSIAIAGLQSSTTYHYRVRSADAAGNLAISGNQTFTTAAAPTSLIAAYAFDEGIGTVVRDQSSQLNDGSISGATWTTAGRYNRALVFDGVNDIVSISDAGSLDLTTGMTLEAWVYPTTSSGWQTVLLKEIPGELSYTIYANDNAARAAGLIRIGSTTRYARSTATPPLNTWTHLAVTYDGATLRFYRNGVQDAATAVTGSMVTSASPLRIGGNLVWGEYFAGRIDEVRIYNRALAAAEIQTDMATPLGNPPAPDTLPPTVSLTAPAAGASISGTVTVSATAADNIGVAGVQFRLDDAPLGAEDTAAPFSVSWSTTSVPNGAHVLTARARDAAGNTTTSSAVSVTVNNGGGGGNALTVNGANRMQAIDGFGVTINSASWKNGELIPALDLLVDQNGSSIIRVTIDNPDWESTNDNADPQVFNWTYYNTIYSSAKFNDLWSTMAYLNQKGITSNLILNFMGPGPAWMGGSDLAAGREDEWVEMAVSVAYYARFTKGLQFGIYAPNNEPDWDGIEGIRVNRFRWPDLMARLANRLDAVGLSDLRLLGPDTAQIAEGVQGYLPEAMRNPTLMAKLDSFAFHNYSGDTGGAADAISESTYPNKNFWMTEFSRTQDLFPMIAQGASAALLWDGYDSVYNHAILAGRGTSPPNDAGNGPAALSYANGIYTPRKVFYEMAQLFKFVRPGSTRIAATESTSVTVYAFHNQASGAVTIVGWNTGSSNVSFAGTLANLPSVPAFQFHVTTASVNLQRGPDVPVSNNAFLFSAPAGSVFTLAYPGAAPPAPVPAPAPAAESAPGASRR